ncbi:MAG: hypothetical protein ACFFCS_23365 [Candidatus Hodarchaeota archaeon]
MIIMHVDASPVPEGEIDEWEDAWEEIEDFGKKKDQYTREKSYIMLENRKSGDFLAEMGIDGWYDFSRIIMSPVDVEKWGLVINEEPEKIVNNDELKKVVQEFFEGKYNL